MCIYSICGHHNWDQPFPNPWQLESSHNICLSLASVRYIFSPFHHSNERKVWVTIIERWLFQADQKRIIRYSGFFEPNVYSTQPYTLVSRWALFGKQSYLYLLLTAFMCNRVYDSYAVILLYINISHEYFATVTRKTQRMFRVGMFASI